MMNFPVLSVITFTPIVAGILILLLPAQRKNETRAVALAAATFALILSFWMYLHYDQAVGGYQFVEQYSWLPMLLGWMASARRLSC
jgi:NADH-quinone oxidoreductase subunit M